MGDWVKRYGNDLFILACIILIAIIGYNLGRITALQKTPIKITRGADIFQAGESNPKRKTWAGETSKPKPVHPDDPRVVASKSSSSKKYHFTWCSGAKKIKPENQVWFDTAQAAQAAGYTLAGNCQ